MVRYPVMTLFELAQKIKEGLQQFHKNGWNNVKVHTLLKRIIDLHLASLHEFIKYFFAHDQINYARLSPIYIASMLLLKQPDPSTSEYLEENFSVNNTGIPFTSIGSDHALEQNNSMMKTIGGIVDLTQNQSSLNRYFLIARVLNQLFE